MLASTVQFSTNNRRPPHPTRRPAPTGRWYGIGAAPDQREPSAPSGPNSVPTPDPPAGSGPRTGPASEDAEPMPYWKPARCAGRTGQRSTLEHHPAHPRPPDAGGRSRLGRGPGPPEDTPGRPVLLRKEVIQPHLPVRLPCYDFVPIA